MLCYVMLSHVMLRYSLAIVHLKISSLISSLDCFIVAIPSVEALLSTTQVLATRWKSGSMGL